MSMNTLKINRKGRNLAYFLASLATSIFLVWYLLSQIALQDLLKTFQNLYPASLTLYLLLATGGIITRTYRYHILLAPHTIGFMPLVWVTLVRNLFVDLLPARIGSLSYVYLLNQRFGFPFEVAASTFLIAFIFDFVVILPLIFLAILLAGPSSLPFSISHILLLSVLLFLALAALVWHLDRLLKGLANLFGFLFPQPGGPKNHRIRFLINKLLLTAKDVTAIKRRKIYARVFLSSLAIRLFKYGSLYFLLHAVLVHLGFVLKDLNFLKVFLGILGAEFSALLPIHGIAGLGTWEGAWVVTFKLMGFFDPKIAILSGFSVHLITQIFEYSLGVFAMLIIALPLWTKRGAANANGKAG